MENFRVFKFARKKFSFRTKNLPTKNGCCLMKWPASKILQSLSTFWSKTKNPLFISEKSIREKTKNKQSCCRYFYVEICHFWNWFCSPCGWSPQKWLPNLVDLKRGSSSTKNTQMMSYERYGEGGRHKGVPILSKCNCCYYHKKSTAIAFEI